MIINQIHIRNYGKWHDATISLPGSLAILYGPNEAGKTTLLSFIRGVLFGFPARNPKHYIPRQAKNYGGQLVITSHHHRYVLERQSGKHGGTLKVTDLAGHAQSKQVLDRILGPIDRSAFDALFYFGNVNLKNVAKLKRRDLIQQIQKIGMADSQTWITLRQSLEKQARQVYSPTGYRPVLNQQLKSYQRLSERVDQAKNQYHDYLALTKQSRMIATRKQRLNHRLQLAKQHLKLSHQIQNEWVQYQRLADLKSKVDRPIRPGFEQSDDQQLARLINTARSRQNQLTVLKEQIRQQRAAVVDDDGVRTYRQHRSLIKNLAGQFKEIRQQIQTAELHQRSLMQINHSIQQLKPRFVVKGKIQSPLDLASVNSLKRLRDQIEQVEEKLTRLKAQKVRAESHISTDSKAHSLFRARKLIPGVGLLMLDVSLIKTGDLKKSGRYQSLKTLYQRPKQLQERMYYYQRSLKKMREKVQALSRRYHYPMAQHNVINNWLAMQGNLTRLHGLVTRKREIPTRLKRFRDHLHSYLKQWSFWRSVPDQWPEDPVECFKAIEASVQSIEQTLTKNQQSRAALVQFRKQSRSIEAQSQQNEVALQKFYVQRHVKDLNGFRDQMQRQQRLRDQKQEYRKLSQQFGTQKLAKLNQQSGNVKKLAARANQVQKRVTDLSDQLQSLIQHQVKVATQLQQMARDGSYDQLRQQLTNAQTGVNELVHRWLLFKLSGEWINQALNLANQGRVPKIERQARSYFEILTNHHYVNLIFNKTKITVLSNHQHRFDLHELSKGTLQQLYLAMVFALAQIFGADYPLPILIDDGFTDFDVERRQKALELLQDLSQHLQIIYCTSDDRVKQKYPVKMLSKY